MSLTGSAKNLVNKKQSRMSKIKLWMRNNVIHSNWFFRTIAILSSFIVCFIPTGIFIGVYFWLSPTDFWEKFVIICMGLVALGWLQFLGIILFIYLVVLAFDN